MQSLEEYTFDMQNLLAVQLSTMLSAHNFVSVSASEIMGKSSRYIVEAKDGELLGAVGIERVQWYQTELKHLVVHPDYRRKHLATKLVRAAEQLAQRRDAQVLQCTVRVDNIASLLLLGKLGYTNTHSTFKSRISGYDIAILQKVLVS